jgi:hypothetical protein
MFLARFTSGWRVMAVACARPDTPGPYECDVDGG